MAISNVAVDGSLPSSLAETLKAQSLIVSPSSLPNETISSESRDDSPSNLIKFSTTTAGSDKAMDGFSPSSDTEVRGDHYLNSQLPNLSGSSSVIPVTPNGQALVPLLSNTEVSNDQSLVDMPMETRDFESFVSSNGTESSPSSPVDPGPRETLLDEEDCNDHKSAMQIDSKGNPSSLPVSWELLREEPNEGNFDDTELNLANDELTSEVSCDGSYHPCNCNRCHKLYRPAHQWGGSCGLHYELNRPFYDSWPASGGRWRYDREDRPLSLLLPVPTGVGAGLSNLGNTCFINAILQCFTHTVPFVKALRSSNHFMPCQRGFEGFCVLCVLRDHIELSLASSGKIISPSRVVDNLNYISSCFHRYQQEDAHEFLQCLLDKLERCCLDSNPSEEASSLQDDNIVERVFGGRLVSKLRCCNCGHCSDKYEPLIDLSLEIEDVETLQSALQSFTKVETIEDIECDNCKEEVSMEKQLMLDQAPSVAALHLKRFKTNGSYIEKIGKQVQFPLELSLKPYTNAREDSHEPQVHLKYQLYAIVVHNGFLPTSGHYFSYIRSSPGTWHKLDDSRVIKVEEEMVLSEAAYILFYVKEGTPWFSSLMETEKDCLYPRISNTSPKSVLDNMDTECAACTDVESMDLRKASVNRGDVEGTSTPLSCCAPVVEGAQINQIRNDAEKSGHDDESSNGVPMYDVSVSLEVEATNFHDGSLHSEKFGSLAYAEENNGGQVVHRNARNDDLDPRSSSPDMNFGGQPEARHCIQRDHLKAGSSVINKMMKKGTRDQRTEALRYLRKNVTNSRTAKLLEAMLPQNDRKRRLRSSPCKQGTLPGSRAKLHREAVFR